MSTTEVKVPQLPESVADATLVNWHKQVGDAVERDENLVDIETDKVVLECPSPISGILKEIKAEDGATVTGGEVIAILEEGLAKTGAGVSREAGEKAKPEEAEQGHAPETAAAKSPAGDTGGAVRAPKPLSPSVRRLVEEHDLDPGRIEGTGRDGRLTKADVMQYLEGGEATATSAPSVPAGKERLPRVSAGREDRRVPMTRIRARIAERLVESQKTAAMLTSFNEVNLGKVIELRTRYKEKFEKDHGVRLGFMSFFVKAAIESLQRYPVVNASIEGNDIVYHDYWDIGIAVSTPKGLVVPILRDADQQSFAEIEQGISDYARKAREGGLSMDDLTGGTFTITNGGVFGSLISTPIINPPQSAILGMHKIEERPMVENGQIVVRPMMYIALTYDHRIIDGREAVLFLVSVKELLEDPARLMLQI